MLHASRMVRLGVEVVEESFSGDATAGGEGAMSTTYSLWHSLIRAALEVAIVFLRRWSPCWETMEEMWTFALGTAVLSSWSRPRHMLSVTAFIQHVLTQHRRPPDGRLHT